MDAQSESHDYIVVGSGAGGGTVAARLAEQGCKVLVLEAGDDPLAPEKRPASGPGTDRLPEDMQVPAFHAFSTENQAMSWEFFVRHYRDSKRQARDPKFEQEKDGVFYPRAGALGGCTAHNAMIFVQPHNEDWDAIAYQTGDASWRAENMRKYFQRLENCRHRPGYRWLVRLGINPTRHGFGGWLPTEKAIPIRALLGDGTLVRTLKGMVFQSAIRLPRLLQRVKWQIYGQFDPNGWRLAKSRATGLRYTPLNTSNHARYGTRERLRSVRTKYPDNLHIELNALASKVLFDNDNRAVGVEYLKGERLYRAHPNPSTRDGERRNARLNAGGEVILSGGAFNTPQLLMLSGIGPRAHLEEHKIPVRVDLPGVGRNLQDRYEVGIVYKKIDPKTRKPRPWEVLKGARYEKDDPQYLQWVCKRTGVYTTNGAVLALIKRSVETQLLPDLFCFALLGDFRGYERGYSKRLKNPDYLTWAILKAHTTNSGGSVELKSSCPREQPLINFRYFDEGNGKLDAHGEDLDANAVIQGIRFVRKLVAEVDELEEEFPGPHLQSDAELRRFVEDHAWGHHASCTCPIGSREKLGVVDSEFRVHGTQGLRIVDASVFPKIPGFFIVSSIYVMAEKAADTILEAAAGPHAG